MTLMEAMALVAIGGVAGFINVLSAGGSMLTPQPHPTLILTFRSAT